MSIQRYDLVRHCPYPSGWYDQMEPDDEGWWCKWDDVEAEIERLRSLLARVAPYAAYSDSPSLVGDVREALEGGEG